jgi:hypothetical protein
VSRCGVGRAQLARVQRGELAVQLEVGTAVREQRFERLRALRVQTELALERLALAQRIGRGPASASAASARPVSPARARALRARDGSARAPRPGRSGLLLERAQRAARAAELAVRARDPREQSALSGCVAAQPLEPRQRGGDRDALPRDACGAIDERFAFRAGRSRARPLARRATRSSALAFEQRRELRAQRGESCRLGSAASAAR